MRPWHKPDFRTDVVGSAQLYCSPMFVQGEGEGNTQLINTLWRRFSVPTELSLPSHPPIFQSHFSQGFQNSPLSAPYTVHTRQKTLRQEDCGHPGGFLSRAATGACSSFHRAFSVEVSLSLYIFLYSLSISFSTLSLPLGFIPNDSLTPVTTVEKNDDAALSVSNTFQ